MTTGQHPQRRETEAQEARRNEQATDRRKAQGQPELEDREPLPHEERKNRDLTFEPLPVDDEEQAEAA